MPKNLRNFGGDTQRFVGIHNLTWGYTIGCKNGWQNSGFRFISGGINIG